MAGLDEAVSIGNGDLKDVGAEARLCIGMLKSAIKDMRKPCLSHNRLSAISWLASSAATPWFDYLDIDQRYALERIGWTVHAEDLLRNIKEREHPPGKPLSRSQIRLVRDALAKLEGKE